MTNALQDKRIGLLGCGVMARALTGGLLSSGVAADRLAAADPVSQQREDFERELQVTTHADNAQVVEGSDVIVIAVTPAAVATIFRDLAGSANLDRPLWISIVAGIPLATLGEGLPGGARIVRVLGSLCGIARL